MMTANLPQTLEGVTRLYERLRRDGVIRDGSSHRKGDRVQVRIRGVVLCGRVLGEVSGGEDRPVRLAVVTALGDCWVRPFDIRACSEAGDARCGCATAKPARGRGARCVPSPLGNTGVAA
jgi:hypothetical protein